MTDPVPFATLEGRVVMDIYYADGGAVVIVTDDGVFRLAHCQQWCEQVDLIDVTGSPEDIIGTTIITAEEVWNHYEGDVAPVEYAASWSWPSYRILTTQGDVTFRWLGVSTGYYSETVDLVRARSLDPDEYRLPWPGLADI